MAPEPHSCCFPSARWSEGSQLGAVAGLLLGRSPAEGSAGDAGPAATSSLRLIRLLRGAVALRVHLPGVVEGSPRGAHPGRGPGRWAAELRGGSDRGDQAGDLGEPREGGREEPAGQEVPSLDQLSCWGGAPQSWPRMSKGGSREVAASTHGTLTAALAPRPWPGPASDPLCQAELLEDTRIGAQILTQFPARQRPRALMSVAPHPVSTWQGAWGPLDRCKGQQMTADAVS